MFKNILMCFHLLKFLLTSCDKQVATKMLALGCSGTYCVYTICIKIVFEGYF